MNPFKSAIKKLETIAQTNETELFLESIEKPEEKLIIKLNTEKQLFRGINSEGKSLESIGGEYSPNTIEIKKEKGQPTDRVTLKDTGDFYRSFGIIKTNTGLLIKNNPIKDETNLLSEWGNEIIGLTSENKAILNAQILPKQKKIILRNFRKA